jgi:hypothetical protein
LLACTLITVNYISCYAGLIEYSPSAEIVIEVLKRMPRGVPLDELRITTLTDESLVGKRVQHLLRARLIVEDAGSLIPTLLGSSIVKVTVFYRKLLLQSPFGEG